MYVVEVIPLTLLPPNAPQILSYFYDPAPSLETGQELSKGSIVEVIINNRKVKAVVISSSPIEKEKLALKKSGFQIKKITKVLYDKPQISNYQLKLAVWISKHYYAPLGYTLKTILPPFYFKKKFPVTVFDRPASQTVSAAKPRLLVYKTKKLAGYLKPLISESLDNLKQVLIIVPEKASVRYFSDNLPSGADPTIVFSSLPNTKQYESWQNIQSGKAKVIIGTRQALNIPFYNLGLIIIDDPNNEAYKSDMTPRYNAVNLAFRIAELNGSQIIFTSVMPNIEEYHKTSRGLYKQENIEPRPDFDVEIIDMAQEIRDGNWSSISKKTYKEIDAAAKDGKKVLIFAPRRGYAGIMICTKCGSSVKCPRCDAAMRTHRSVEIILACHRCGTSRPVPANCPVCGNYNMKTAGPAGTQKIYEEVKFRLANSGIKTPVLVLDTDIVKNETEEEEIISEINSPGSSVLIATQMVFSRRFYVNFDLIVVANADALMNMPDFRSEENLFHQIEKLVCFSPAKLVVQTYNPDSKIIEKAVRNDYTEFYENELKLREALNYPPFFKLIKLTFRHKDKNKSSYAARLATEKLKMAVARMRLGETVKIVEATPAYIEKERDLYAHNIFIKVRSDYPDFGNLLQYAGPGWIIDVEPRSLL